MAKPIVSFVSTDTAIQSAITAYATADGKMHAAIIDACITLQGKLKAGRMSEDFIALFFAHVDKVKGSTTPDAERGRFKGAVRLASMSYCDAFMGHAKTLLPSVTYLGRLAAWCRADFADPSNGPTLDQVRAKLATLKAESNKAKSTKGDVEAKAKVEAVADDKVTPDKRLARVVAAVTDYVAKAGDPAGHVAIALQHLQAEATRLTAIIAAPVEASEYETGKPVEPAAPVVVEPAAPVVKVPRKRNKR